MKILYDLIATQPVSGNRFHGAAEYAVSLFSHLAARSGGDMLVCAAGRDPALDQGVRDVIARHGLALIRVDGARGLPAAAREAGADTVYSALPYDFGGLDFGSTRLVCTVHGLRPLEVPTDRYEMRYASSARDVAKFLAKNLAPGIYRRIRRSDFAGIFRSSRDVSIIVPSEHTRRSLLYYFPDIPEGALSVFPSPRALAPSPADPSGLTVFDVAPRRFFLLTGANRWIKNSYRAVKALDRLFSEESGIEAKALVLGIDSGRIFGRLDNPDRFVFRGYVERDMLELLYSSALCFVYPTLNEGFGYPPIEAMKYGTPVICSDTSSVPEVCGSGAAYFDPLSIDGIASCAARIALDGETRRSLSEAGLSRAAEIMAAQEKSLGGIASVILGTGAGTAGGGKGGGA